MFFEKRVFHRHSSDAVLLVNQRFIQENIFQEQGNIGSGISRLTVVGIQNTEFILVLFLNYYIIFHINNCKTNFAPPWILGRTLNRALEIWVQVPTLRRSLTECALANASACFLIWKMRVFQDDHYSPLVKSSHVMKPAQILPKAVLWSAQR